MLSLNECVQARADMLSYPVDGETVILNMEKGVYLNLNTTATEALHGLASPRRLSDLCDELAGKFDAPREEIERDILELVQKMVEVGLVRIV